MKDQLSYGSQFRKNRVKSWHLTIIKNSRQNNKPQLRTTLLLYYTTGFRRLSCHHQVYISEVKIYKT
jgi:hypothetical protein